jgi:homoserine kinase
MANEIPVARGQGSSAAAIVAGMATGQLLVRGTVDRDALVGQATLVEGHPDNVAAAVMGGLVLTREVGGNVRVRSVPTTDGAMFVSAVPEFELTTHASRAVLPRQVPLVDAVYNLRATAWLAAAWAAGDWHGVAEAMDDRLHQPYRAALIPGFNEVCAAAREAGALAACLSGSGPSILALALDGADRVATAMEDAWRALGIASRAEVTKVDTEGLVILANDE